MLPQAFIVFKWERHRNHLVKLFYRTRWQRIVLNTPFAACLDAQELPLLCAADGAGGVSVAGGGAGGMPVSMPVSLSSAPEPSDVFWEARLHPTLSPSHSHSYTLTLIALHPHQTLTRPSPLARTSRKAPAKPCALRWSRLP